MELTSFRSEMMTQDKNMKQHWETICITRLHKGNGIYMLPHTMEAKRIFLYTFFSLQKKNNCTKILRKSNTLRQESLAFLRGKSTKITALLELSHSNTETGTAKTQLFERVHWSSVLLQLPKSMFTRFVSILVWTNQVILLIASTNKLIFLNWHSFKCPWYF